MSLLVSGANDFISSAILKMLSSKGLKVQSASYNQILHLVKNYINNENVRKEDLLSKELKGIGTIVHCADRVNMIKKDNDKIAAFREANVDGTLGLARAAAGAGVKRFIFISSIKVNGEATYRGNQFQYTDLPAPEDAYGQCKMEAEVGLWEIARNSDLEVVVIRPPLVYYPGAKANFAALMKLAKNSFPLPLGAIQNKRSMVALENLVSLIVVCITHPKAANQTFLVSDDQDVSTTELLELMTRAAGKKPRMLPVPMSWLTFGATVLGKKAIADRLCGSLQIDISHTKETLGWVPPISLEEGIQQCFQQGE